MSRTRGQFNFAGNFEVKSAKLLDARCFVETYNDLFNASTWIVDGINYLTEGLVVYCRQYNSLYVYINNNPDLYAAIGSWRTIQNKITIIDNVIYDDPNAVSTQAVRRSLEDIMISTCGYLIDESNGGDVGKVYINDNIVRKLQFNQVCEITSTLDNNFLKLISLGTGDNTYESANGYSIFGANLREGHNETVTKALMPSYNGKLAFPISMRCEQKLWNLSDEIPDKPELYKNVLNGIAIRKVMKFDFVDRIIIATMYGLVGTNIPNDRDYMIYSAVPKNAIFIE